MDTFCNESGSATLHIEEENKRKFVRLQLSGSLSLDCLKPAAGDFFPQADGTGITGRILNISVGGVLADLDEAVEEGDIVIISFALENTEPLGKVLGLVKRTDIDSEGVLAGIEFIDPSILFDRLTSAEMEQLTGTVVHFKSSISKHLEERLGTEVREL